MTAMTAADHRRKLFTGFIRQRVKAELIKKGMTPADAQAAVNELDDDTINHFASESKVGKIGDGTFLQWIIDHAPQIMQLIQTLVQMLLMLHGIEGE